MKIAQYKIFKAQATFFYVIYRFVKIGDNYIITDEVQQNEKVFTDSC